MEKLKPCPYCNGKAKMQYRMPYTVVYCENGCVQMRVSDSYEQEDSKAEAVEEWNRMASRKVE